MRADGLLSLDDALALDGAETCALYARHINPVFVENSLPMGLVRRYVRAEGLYLWDDAGRRYADFFSAFGCLNLGHNHPRVLAALRAVQERGLPLLHQLSPAPLAAALAHNLARLLPEPLRMCSFQSSGSEVVDAALKLARAFTGRAAALAAHGSYHGNTLGALALTGMPRYREPFGPQAVAVDYVDFGDPAQLEERLRTRAYAALFLEPIQGQGGVRVPPPGYLAEARRLCERHGTLLVFDEVQTGLGRTGTLFAFEHEGAVPDVLLLSKSLGGGVLPISACITSRRVWSRVYGSRKTFALHSSTFAANGAACAAALATLEALHDEKLVENSARLGSYLAAELRRLRARHAVIAEVRGRGLMAGVRLDLSGRGLLPGVAHRAIRLITPKMVTSHAAARLLAQGFVVTPSLTDEHVLRIFPPLIVGRAEIDAFIAAFDTLCASLGGYTRVLGDTVGRFAGQRLGLKARA